MLPEAIGSYQVEEEIARGGMGVVYRARDRALNRTIAIKMLRSVLPIDEQDRNRFQREAQAAAKLRHPHIVPIFHVGDCDGVPFFCMAYLAGGSLARHGQAFSQQPRAAATLMMKVARAVHHAHEQGVLHRDLKPANILLDEQGEPHVSDFGLAKLLDSDVELTRHGTIIGTPAYMAPEQARGENDLIGPPADVWALGVILYQILSGQRPFKGETRSEVTHSILSTEPPSLQAIVPGVDSDLEAVILKCLAKDPQERLASAGELADELGRWLRGEPIHTRPPTHLTRWRAAINRRPVTSLALGSLPLLGGLALIAWMPARQESTTPSPTSPIPPPAATRSVHLVTEPPGAAITLVPIGDAGELLTDKLVKTAPGQATPCVLENVAPGCYLVIAIIPDQGFHEVYRTVPVRSALRIVALPAGLGNAWKHRSYETLPDDSVELPAIQIPPASVSDGMARFDGGKFRMGLESLRQAQPVHERSLAPYFLDRTEVTVAEYTKNGRALPAALRDRQMLPNHAVSWVSFDEAMAYAEDAGKRLPDEAEYEFAARNGGKTLFPWGDDERPMISWPLGPVGPDDPQAQFDRTLTQPPVYGLYSNVGEWTLSWGNPYPNPAREVIPPEGLEALFRDLRVVRGAPYSILMFERGLSGPDPAAWPRGPAQRQSISRDRAYPWLGFRCARSAAPRFAQSGAPLP